MTGPKKNSSPEARASRLSLLPQAFDFSNLEIRDRFLGECASIGGPSRKVSVFASRQVHA